MNLALIRSGKRPTLAPSTTQPTTEPTPLPFDPTVLQQTVVFLRYNSSQSYAEMLDILTQYTLSSIYPSEGDIQPPLRYVPNSNPVQKDISFVNDRNVAKRRCSSETSCPATMDGTSIWTRVGKLTSKFMLFSCLIIKRKLLTML